MANESWLPIAYGGFLVLARTTALFASAPILSSQLAPTRVRLNLAVVVAVAIFLGSGAHPAPLPDHLTELMLAAAGEAIFGLAAGLAAAFVFEAALSAGHLASTTMGLGFAAQVDPINGVESTAIGRMTSMAALGFALTMGLHREAIRYLTRSVTEFPVGSSLPLKAMLTELVSYTVYSCALAVRLAFPILGAITLGHVALGLIGKVSPQLNLSSLGFSVAIIAGGGALYYLAPAVAQAAAEASLSVFVRS